jgi:hypothetical protein
MCCEGWYNYPKNYKESDIAKCPDCGGDVDSDGYAMSGCAWSPVSCETCGDAPCDGSC